MILQMKLGRISRGYFRRKFGADITERFAGPFRMLESEGLLKIEGDVVQLTREGLLSVDSLLPEFYQAEYRHGHSG
jgi:oxygen-independent coproporphyrinogen-3 oxidase